MQQERLSIDTRVANALVSRVAEERWPLRIQRSIPFRTENDTHMVDITVEYEDNFPFGEKLSETINRLFNLIPKEP